MNGSVAETRDILSLKASGDMFTSAAKGCANDDDDGPHCAEVNDGQESQMNELYYLQYVQYEYCSQPTCGPNISGARC